MSFINYSSSSAYATTQQSSNFIGLYKHRNIPEHSDDRPYVIPAEFHNRPDLAAYRLYQDPSYWWVFLSRNINEIRDPIWDFTAGKEIIIPSIAYLRNTIG